jgi:hypothetical protein
MCSRKIAQVHAACRHIFSESKAGAWAQALPRLRGQLSKRHKLLGENEERKSAHLKVYPPILNTNSLELPLRAKRMPVNTTPCQFNLTVLFCLALQLLPQSLGETNGLLKIK